MKTALAAADDPEALMASIKAEDEKEIPNYKHLEKLVGNFIESADPDTYCIDFYVAEAMYILTRAYILNNEQGKAKTTLAQLYDFVRNAESENSPQATYLYHLFDELHDYSGLIKYCDYLLPVVEQYYATEIKERGGVIYKIGIPPNQKEQRRADVLTADLEIMKERIARFRNKAQQAISEIQAAENLIRNCTVPSTSLAKEKTAI